MFEIVGSPKVAPTKIVVRCTGLNERGQRCKKRLFDYRPPVKTVPSGTDVGVIESLCSRCGTMNHVKPGIEP